MVEVTQADRELFITLSNADGQMAERILCGQAFTWEVEQIARHRLADHFADVSKMVTVEVTQADREAAKRYFREADTSDVFHGTELAQAFARQRLAAIDAVVKWLRDQAADKQDREWMGPLDIADYIEARFGGRDG